MDPFTISCETCHASLNVHQEEAIGQIHACPRCGSMVLVQRPATGEDVSAEESTTDGRPEPAVVGKRRRSLGPPATGVIANAAGPGPTQHDGAILADLTGAAPSAVPPNRLDVSGNQDTIQVATAAGQLGAASRTDDAVVGSVPDATWATSGQNWIRGWAMYSAAALVGVVGSIALCSAIITWNDSQKNQPGAVEAEPPQPAPSNDVVMPMERPVEQHDPAAHAYELEQAALPLDAIVPDVETPDLETSDDGTLLVSTSAPHQEISVETPTLHSQVDLDESEVTTDESVPGDQEDETQVDADEATTVESPPRQVPPREVDLGAQLAVVIPAIEFDGDEIQDCIRFLSDLTTIPISIHPEALLLAGRSPNSPVRRQIEDRSVRDILNEVLRAHHLAYAVQDNQIVVTNRATGAGGLKEITYPIDDLLQDKSASSEQLVQLITSMVAPDSWAARGDPAMVVAEGGSLVIRQTGPIHWEILQLCEKLRVARELPLRSRHAGERFELTARAERAQPTLASAVSLNYVAPARLIEILDRVEEQTKTQILVHWLSTHEVGVYPDFETTFTVQDQPLGQALHDLLLPLGLTYRVVDRAILQITSQDYLEHHHEIELHRVDSWPPDDPAGEQLAARIESTLGIGGPESGQLLMLPNDRLVITRLPQPKQSKLARYLKFRANEKRLLDR